MGAYRAVPFENAVLDLLDADYDIAVGIKAGRACLADGVRWHLDIVRDAFVASRIELGALAPGSRVFVYVPTDA